MKIFHYRLDLIDPFGIARMTRTSMDVVLANVDGGWGEAAPIKFYDEDVQSVEATLRRIEETPFADLDCFEDIERTVASTITGNQSAKAAFDIALHDRFARKLGVPL